MKAFKLPSDNKIDKQEQQVDGHVSALYLWLGAEPCTVISSAEGGWIIYKKLGRRVDLGWKSVHLCGLKGAGQQTLTSLFGTLWYWSSLLIKAPLYC